MGSSSEFLFFLTNNEMDDLHLYSSLPNQQYPLNVCLDVKLVSTLNIACDPPYAPISFSQSQNLYQRLKNKYSNQAVFRSAHSSDLNAVISNS